MLRNWNVDTFSIIDIIMGIIVIEVKWVRKSTARQRIMKGARALALEGHGTCSGGICLQQSDLPTGRAVENVRIIDSPLRGVVWVLVTKTTG
jgi:hypothetical protein